MHPYRAKTANICTPTWPKQQHLYPYRAKTANICTPTGPKLQQGRATTGPDKTDQAAQPESKPKQPKQTKQEPNIGPKTKLWLAPDLKNETLNSGSRSYRPEMTSSARPPTRSPKTLTGKIRRSNRQGVGVPPF